MSSLVVHSASQQVATYLRGELLRRTWSGVMPGGDRLAEELGIGRDTVEAALRQLENEGLLVNQGRRSARLIRLPNGAGKTTRIRVAILLYEPMDRGLDYMIKLSHELESAGHAVVFAPKSLTELGMDLGRIARMVEKTEANAWLVLGGSGEVLEWFATRDQPVMALFGRRRGMGIANVGPDKTQAMAAVTQALLDLGHRRIVLMVRRLRRLPNPGAAEQTFLDNLAAAGIPFGTYNLPDWEESVEGFYARLEELFRVTPPTALILDEVRVFFAAQQFMVGKGLRVPGDVSLVCTDYEDSFEWCRPRISHIRWDSQPVVKRILQWASNVSHGKTDLRQTLTPAEFVKGGTIGPAKEK